MLQNSDFSQQEQYDGMLVYKVKAEDEDSNENGIVDYGLIVNGVYTTTTPEFTINSITGVIHAEKVYDRETVDKYLVRWLIQHEQCLSVQCRKSSFQNILVINFTFMQCHKCAQVPGVCVYFYFL